MDTELLQKIGTETTGQGTAVVTAISDHIGKKQKVTRAAQDKAGKQAHVEPAFERPDFTGAKYYMNFVNMIFGFSTRDNAILIAGAIGLVICNLLKTTTTYYPDGEILLALFQALIKVSFDGQLEAPSTPIAAELPNDPRCFDILAFLQLVIARALADKSLDAGERFSAYCIKGMTAFGLMAKARGSDKLKDEAGTRYTAAMKQMKIKPDIVDPPDRDIVTPNAQRLYLAIFRSMHATRAFTIMLSPMTRSKHLSNPSIAEHLAYFHDIITFAFLTTYQEITEHLMAHFPEIEYVARLTKELLIYRSVAASVQVGEEHLIPYLAVLMGGARMGSKQAKIPFLYSLAIAISNESSVTMKDHKLNKATTKLKTLGSMLWAIKTSEKASLTPEERRMVLTLVIEVYLTTISTINAETDLFAEISTVGPDGATSVGVRL